MGIKAGSKIKKAVLFYKLPEKNASSEIMLRVVWQESSMKQKSTGLTVMVVLGIISFGSLVLCYLAAVQLFQGVGDSAAHEWIVLKRGIWPIVVFHAVFFVNSTISMAKWRK